MNNITIPDNISYRDVSWLAENLELIVKDIAENKGTKIATGGLEILLASAEMLRRQAITIERFEDYTGK